MATRHHRIARKSGESAPRPPGRPRSEASKQAILESAFALLKKRGIAAVSMQQLAGAAGVSTATLYRWWDTKEAIMLDAFFEHVRPALSVEGDGSPLERFRDQVIRGAAWIQSPDGRVATRLIGDVQDDGKLHQLFLERFYLPRRSIYVKLMKEAIAAGELRPETDIDLLIDALHGPIYFRAILGHAAPDRAFVTELVDRVLPAFTS